MSHLNAHYQLSCLPFLCLVLPLAACGDETVNLGGGRISQSVTSGSRCAESSVVSESVRVQSQADLEDLAGCEQIDGDLQVEVFAGADLSPLSSLRIVGGLLELGTYVELPEEGLDTSDYEIIRAQVDAIVADGYLPSLQGLEGLERAASLDFYYLAAEDLSALLTLRELSGKDGASPIGFVGLHDSQVRSLHGLENVENIRDLVMSDNPELESLGGVTLGSAAHHLQFISSPKLTSLAELAPVETAYTLSLQDVGVTDLSDLESFYFAEFDITLNGNRKLVNVDAAADFSTERLSISGNPVLTSIPQLTSMTYLETFTVLENPALETLDIALPVHGGGPDSVEGTLLTDPIKLIDIGRNARLSQVSLAAGLEEGRFVSIHGNAALESVSVGSLSHLESLRISANPNLTQVDLGALQTVGSLYVSNSPGLDTTELANVRTFETTLQGNAPPTP